MNNKIDNNQNSLTAEVTNTERSRLIKTAIPDYVREDFLYIDCDTIICDDLSGIEQYPYDIAGVLDGHVLLKDHIHQKYFLERDKKLGFSGAIAPVSKPKNAFLRPVADVRDALTQYLTKI